MVSGGVSSLPFNGRSDNNIIQSEEEGRTDDEQNDPLEDDTPGLSYTIPGAFPGNEISRRAT